MLSLIKKRLGVAVGVLLLSILLQLPLASSTLAATDISSLTLDKQTLSLYYYRAVKVCLDQATVATDYRKTDENVTKGHWIIKSGNFSGYYAADQLPAIGTDGGSACDDNETQLFRNAFALWGIEPLDIVCGNRTSSTDDAFIREDGSNCYSGTGNFKLSTAYGNVSALSQELLSRMLDQVYGGTAPSLTPQMRYIYYLETFLKGCLASGQTGLHTPRDGGTESNELAVGVYDQATTAVVTMYGRVDPFKLDRAIKVWPNGDGMTCKELANQISPDSALASAFAVYAKANPDEVDGYLDPNTGIDNETESQASTCLVEGVGWIVCPVTEFLASITDSAYSLVSELLEFNGFTVGGDENSSLKSSWDTMQSIANIFFVIAFMIIIFSQVTSVGVSNYGIKKLLPKLFAAAILVNTSYWICALAVDLSNLSGSAMKSLFDGFNVIQPPDISGADTSGWLGITGPILAGTLAVGAAMYIGLAALLPALLAAVLSIITAALVLVLRQALLVLLIVISPLAFVALLLPNTEGWFKKWRQLFVTLLLMYPIIGLLFGASGLASSIVMNSASSDDVMIKVAIQIMGALIAVLPLAITPIILKTSGSLLGRFGAMINNPNKGPFDRARKGAERIRKDQEGKRAARAAAGGLVFGRGKYTRAAKREAISEGIQREKNRATSTYVAEQVRNNSEFRNRVAGGSSGRFLRADEDAMQRALDNAQFTIDKVEAEEVQAARVNYTREGMDALRANDELSTNGASLTRAQRIALRDMVVEGGDARSIEGLWNDSANMDQMERNALGEALKKNKPTGIGVGAIAGMAAGNNTNSFRQELANGLVAGRYDPTGSAKSDNSELDMLLEVQSDPVVMRRAAKTAEYYSIPEAERTRPDGTRLEIDDVADSVADVRVNASRDRLRRDTIIAHDDPRFNAGKARRSLEGIFNELGGRLPDDASTRSTRPDRS